MKRTILFSILFIFINYAQGQNATKVSFDIYGGAGLSKLDNGITKTHQSIKPSYRFGALLGGGVYFGYFGINLEVGGFSINDSYSFSQLNTSGNTESKTFGWHATPSLGGKYEVKNFDFTLNLGYAFASAQRAIPDCADCDTEKVDIDNGATIRPK